MFGGVYNKHCSHKILFAEMRQRSNNLYSQAFFQRKVWSCLFWWHKQPQLSSRSVILLKPPAITRPWIAPPPPSVLVPLLFYSSTLPDSGCFISLCSWCHFFLYPFLLFRVKCWLLKAGGEQVAVLLGVLQRQKTSPFISRPILPVLIKPSLSELRHAPHTPLPFIRHLTAILKTENKHLSCLRNEADRIHC